MSRTNRLPYLLSSLLLVGLSTACVAEIQGVEGDDADTLARAADYKSFPRMNAAPYKSGVGGMINLYVSPEGAAAYASYQPGVAAQAMPKIPVGTIIVREVLDDTGKVTKLTMMAKGAPGYQPEFGDWWFAVTDADGAPHRVNEQWQVGTMKACQSCHTPLADKDFLFGVPMNMR
jgi:hypothetical protein